MSLFFLFLRISFFQLLCMYVCLIHRQAVHRFNEHNLTIIAVSSAGGELTNNIELKLLFMLFFVLLFISIHLTSLHFD